MHYSSNFDHNYQTLRKEIDWVGQVFQQQLIAHAQVFLESYSLEAKIAQMDIQKDQEMGESLSDSEIAEIYRNYGQGFSLNEPLPVPELTQASGAYAALIKQYDLTPTDRLVLILGLLPHLQPDVLDQWVKTLKDNVSKLPGNIGIAYPHFLPTGKTALFLLAGLDYQKQLYYQTQLFSPTHPFIQQNILTLGPVPEGEPKINGTLTLSPEYLHWLTTSERYRPVFSQDFPAEQLTTQQTWEDYVLPSRTQTQVEELLDWVAHFHELRQNPAFAKDNKGYKCLLTGPPGTGKTLLGRLLTQKTSREVWRLDMSQLVSKFVGETSKNIQKVFDTARHYDHILFCDEGEGLFSNRTQNAGTAQDTYVNQDVGYLLQAIEEYPGILLVATNNLNNMDDAFMRRFNTRIRFEYPDADSLFQLWQKALDPFIPDHRIDVKFIAREQARQQVTGAQISRVKDLLGIRALKRKNWELSLEELVFALQQKNVSVPNFHEYLQRKAQYRDFLGED